VGARNFFESQSFFRGGKLGIDMFQVFVLAPPQFVLPGLGQKFLGLLTLEDYWRFMSFIIRQFLHIFSKSQSLFRGGKLRIFQSPRAYIEWWGVRNFSESQSLYRGGSVQSSYRSRAFQQGGNLTRTRTQFLRWPPVPNGKAGLPPKS